MKITDDIKEMEKLGREFLYNHATVNPEEYIQEKLARYGSFFDDEKAFLSSIYCGIYCQQMYGSNLIEFAGFHFAEKSHEERNQYITWYNRYIYCAFLNKSSDNHLLDNKFEAYSLLKPFYKREAMLLSDEKDFDAFCAFVRKNPSIFVKPNNLELAEGAHPLLYKEGESLRDTFNALLMEAANISSKAINREIDKSLILEELIVPSAYIKQINPNEMSLVRITTVNVKGKIHFFYPCLRILVGDGVDEIGEDYSYVALIDPDSGRVVTNGKNGLGDSDVNPLTGEKICGMTLPDWDDLKKMITQAAGKLPNTRYIGWDVTHTEKGWCIIEGNTNGEFFYQMCTGRGLRKEFEDLIGFHPSADFWKTPMFGIKTELEQ